MKRLFKGLRSHAPEQSYDAVIIGAGIGGLICANLLARERLRVLLVEQHYMVGGYCSTFRRKGFTFDAATHFYPLLGNPATITGKLLRELGVNNGWVKMDPVDHFHFPDGSTFAVPADFPIALLPEDCGLLIADGYGAVIRRRAAPRKLHASRRRAQTLRLAQAAMLRLSRLLDPDAKV